MTSAPDKKALYYSLHFVLNVNVSMKKNVHHFLFQKSSGLIYMYIGFNYA